MNVKKLTAAAVTALLATSVLAGCGAKKVETPAPAQGGSTTPAPAPKKEPVELNLWTHLTAEEGAVLEKVAQEWATKTGNKVTVTVDTGDMNAFPTVAASGKGPDIMFGLPHDNLGAIYKAGLLAEVPANILNKDLFVPATIQAVSFDGKTYGLPVAMEAVALFYRTDKVKEAPKTWADFEAAAKQHGFMYDVKSTYFSFGFVQGEGGYVFKNEGTAYKIDDIGLANDGAVKGVQLISDLVNKYNFMKADVSGEIAKGKFQAGDTAFYISGSWDVGGFKTANVPFGVAKFPTLPDGKKFMPFSGVQASFVSTTSKHQAEAWDLDKYMVENAAMPLFKQSKRIPVLKSVLDSAEVKSDAIVGGFAASAADATPMPNVAAMGQVWKPMDDALTLAVTKKADAKTAATDAVTKIKADIATNK